MVFVGEVPEIAVVCWVILAASYMDKNNSDMKCFTAHVKGVPKVDTGLLCTGYLGRLLNTPLLRY